jgi:hypothetical protein
MGAGSLFVHPMGSDDTTDNSIKSALTPSEINLVKVEQDRHWDQLKTYINSEIAYSHGSAGSCFKVVNELNSITNAIPIKIPAEFLGGEGVRIVLYIVYIKYFKY